ncbi:MAG: recombinase family protein [Candidatus Gastranaerophilaceae bacterium]|nr:recombinase family protein [Candidatus Gastranaerophilaceae bacterium]
MVKKAVYYGRVSTSEQAETGLSMDMMKDESNAWALAHGYEIVEYFEDFGKTGTKYKGLKELQKLHKYILKNGIDAIICWRLDRISRNDTEFYKYTMDKIEQLNMTICSVKQFPDIKEIPRVLIGVYLGLATDEVTSTKERTKATMLHRAEQGYLMGKAPVGYINKQVNGHGIIVKDEEKAKFVLKAFNLYASGLHTMKSVSLELSKMGFNDKDGKPYPVRKIEHMLKNVVYTGRIKYGTNEDGSDRVFQGKHDPIIPLSLFNKVEAMRRNGGKPNTKHADKTYVKLIKCTCGYYLTGYHSKGAHKSGDYIYYKCHNRKNEHQHIKGIKQETLDKVFSDIINEIHIPQKVVEIIKPKLIKSLDEVYSTENEVYTSNTKRLKELNTIIQKANEERFLGKSLMSDEELSSNMLKWQGEKDILTENIKAASKMNKSVYGNIDTLMKFLQNIENTYMKANIENKQRLLRMVFDKVTYDTETKELTVKLKPIFQALRIAKDNLELCSKKVTTLPKVSSKTISEYLAKNIEISLKNKVTTLKNLSIKEKTDYNEPASVNGAGCGIRTHA